MNLMELIRTDIRYFIPFAIFYAAICIAIVANMDNILYRIRRINRKMMRDILMCAFSLVLGIIIGIMIEIEIMN